MYINKICSHQRAIEHQSYTEEIYVFLFLWKTFTQEINKSKFAGKYIWFDCVFLHPKCLRRRSEFVRKPFSHHKTNVLIERFVKCRMAPKREPAHFWWTKKDAIYVCMIDVAALIFLCARYSNSKFQYIFCK